MLVKCSRYRGEETDFGDLAPPMSPLIFLVRVSAVGEKSILPTWVSWSSAFEVSSLMSCSSRGHRQFLQIFLQALQFTINVFMTHGFIGHIKQHVFSVMH